MFVERFSCLTNNFQVTAGAVGSSFSPSSPEVRGKINLPNMSANTIFASGVYRCICTFTVEAVRNGFSAIPAKSGHINYAPRTAQALVSISTKVVKYLELVIYLYIFLFFANKLAFHSYFSE